MDAFDRTSPSVTCPPFVKSLTAQRCMGLLERTVKFLLRQTYLDCDFLDQYQRWTSESGWLEEAFVPKPQSLFMESQTCALASAKDICRRSAGLYLQPPGRPRAMCVKRTSRTRRWPSSGILGTTGRAWQLGEATNLIRSIDLFSSKPVVVVASHPESPCGMWLLRRRSCTIGGFRRTIHSAVAVATIPQRKSGHIAFLSALFAITQMSALSDSRQR